MLRRRGFVSLGVAMAMAVATACSGTAVDSADQTTGQAGAVATTASTSTTALPPPADIQDLVATTTMTDRARRIFLAAGPVIEDVATFTESCGADSEPTSADQPRSHTQGCYAAGRIHLLHPDHSEAGDLLYVVAAHELLHAVYASLAGPERARIDAEVEAARAGNERLEERLEAYEPGPAFVNEIHSILGSEFDGLSPVLEAHYAQFFSDRRVVVAARQRTLGAREDEIRRLEAEVEDLDARITALQHTQERLRANGDVRSYNSNVPVVNAMIERHNVQLDTLNARIGEYNRLLGG